MYAKETIVIDPSEEEVLDFTYSITSYGADYPVDSLVDRLRENKIRVPSFQRGYVWNEKQASRFIESLLLGLPVPGIFLSKEMDSANLLVIDGQQRLKSLQYFYDGIIKNKVFKLSDVQNRFNGKSYNELDSDDRQRLDDSIIHATIVKQDEPSEDNSSIYLVFERLNTGGLLLRPQEIRSAIYSGDFAELIKDLNKYPQWRNIYGIESTRLKDQEFILRFFAMYFYKDHYKKPLKGFLNTYMAKNRNFQLNDKNTLTEIFKQTVNFVDNVLGKKAFRPIRGINASIYDSIMVGIAEMYSRKSKFPEKEIFLEKYNELLGNAEYQEATNAGTSDEPIVEKRMNLAINAFKDI
jgi:uncharacterized protein with ParB-like and HNH nuclease domain